MKLIILSTSPTGRVAQRFARVAKEKGLDVEVVDAARAESLTTRDLSDTVILPRIAPEKNEIAELLRKLETTGAKVINSARSWELSRDKWQSAIIFGRHGIATPRTISVGGGEKFDSSLGLGSTAVFKPLSGTHGNGIIKVHTGDILPNSVGILQEYREADGKDIRLIVVDSKVVAAMQRQSKSGDFRANLHQGATAQEYSPSVGMQNLAVRAAQSLGLSVAGVDILPIGNGLVLEVNPSPGLGIEVYSGIDIVSHIIDAIAEGRV